MTKSPSGFRSKGHGLDRKVHPIFDPTPRPLRTSKSIHPSREALHQMRQSKLAEYDAFKESVRQIIKDEKMSKDRRRALIEGAAKEHKEHPWTTLRQALAITNDHYNKTHTTVCPQCGAESSYWPVWQGGKRFYRCERCGRIGLPVTKNPGKRASSRDFLAGYDVIRGATTHPEVQYKNPEAWRGNIGEMNITVPKGTKVNVIEKPHNPAEVEVKNLVKTHKNTLSTEQAFVYAKTYLPDIAEDYSKARISDTQLISIASDNMRMTGRNRTSRWKKLQPEHGAQAHYADDKTGDEIIVVLQDSLKGKVFQAILYKKGSDRGQTLMRKNSLADIERALNTESAMGEA